MHENKKIIVHSLSEVDRLENNEITSLNCWETVNVSLLILWPVKNIFSKWCR